MLGWCLSLMVMAVLAASAGGAGTSVAVIAPWAAQALFAAFTFMSVGVFFFGRARLPA